MTRSHPRGLVAVLLLGAAGAVAAAPTGRPSPPRPAMPAAAAVRIDNFTFGPATLTVRAGTTVTWTNGDDIPHTVVAQDRSFRSAVLDTGERFSFTFVQPGSYDYFCSIHPHMTGRVVVTG